LEEKNPVLVAAPIPIPFLPYTHDPAQCLAEDKIGSSGRKPWDRICQTRVPPIGQKLQMDPFSPGAPPLSIRPSALPHPSMEYRHPARSRGAKLSSVRWPWSLFRH